jgi:CheY-like chemotaxis protein
MRVAVEEGRRTKDGGMRLAVEVADSGVGIAENEMDKVFAYFEQTASGRAKKSGSGLGLALSRDFARMMGGDITVSSKKGQGSTFHLNIGIREGRAADIEAKIPKPRVIGLAPGQNSPRVLVAEDMEESRTLLKRMLKMVGFRVREAVNGREAVEIFHAWQPDFIWMDIRMPVMDGLEATRSIKAAEAGKATIVAALTAHALKEEKERILAAGCDDFVRKPFREQEIFGVMAEHLGLKYLYADRRDKTGPIEPEIEIPPERLGVLPAELLSRLHAAVVELDEERLVVLIGQIKTIDAHLAIALEACVKKFALSPLMDLLDTYVEPQQDDGHDST